MDSLPQAQTKEAELAAGQHVGEYVVEEKIGEGGFGSVYRARHPMIGKLAAVKVLSRKYSGDPEIVSRFAAEARAVNQIRHDNIIDIFAFGQLEDGRSYYIMELLDGEPLDGLLAETGGIPLAEALPILHGIARALDAAHAKGIAHRDLKPENVFLSRDSDGNVHPKLLDFGIAKLFGEEQAMHRTRTGSPIGTPYYMSPEQCRGQHVDHRTDIYSFGCVAYQLLTGTRPFDGDNHLDILMKQTMEEPVPPSQRAADNPVLPPLPAAIDGAIAWCMRKDPAQRPASLLAAMAALEDAAGVPETRGSRPSITPSQLPPLAKRTPALGTTALAQTVAATGEQAVPAIEQTGPARSRVPLLAGGALAMAGAVIAFVMLRGDERAPSAPAQVDTSAVDKREPTHEQPADEPTEVAPAAAVERAADAAVEHADPPPTADEAVDLADPSPAAEEAVEQAAKPTAEPSVKPKRVTKRKPTPTTKPRPPAKTAPVKPTTPTIDPYARH